MLNTIKNETKVTIEKILWLLLLSSLSASALLSSLHLLFAITLGVLFFGGQTTDRYSVAVRIRKYIILKVEPPIVSAVWLLSIYVYLQQTPFYGGCCIFEENKFWIP